MIMVCDECGMEIEGAAWHNLCVCCAFDYLEGRIEALESEAAEQREYELEQGEYNGDE